MVRSNLFTSFYKTEYIMRALNSLHDIKFEFLKWFIRALGHYINMLVFNFRNGHFVGSHHHQQVLNTSLSPLIHKPTPEIPMMNFLQFELILLYYLVMAMIIQYMNIYKAVSHFQLSYFNFLSCVSRSQMSYWLIKIC